MKRRKVIFAAMAGLGTAFCFVAGKSLDVNFSLDLTQKSFYMEWLVWSLILGVLIHITWGVASGELKVPARISNLIGKISAKTDFLEKKISIPVAMLLIFLMWVPAWLSIFPGVFSYDAYDEWRQICTGNITAHHPVLHVLYLGGIVEGVFRLTGSYNLGIALCTVIQMLVLAATFAYTIQFMRERNAPPVLRLFAIIFYGCSPVIQLFAICGTKDIFFTAAFLLFLISVYRVCMQRELFFERRKWQYLLVGSALFTMIMRNNGLYIVLITLAVTAFMCRKNLKKYLLLCTAVAAVYLLYVGPFYNVLQVEAGGVEEMLSVPLQQIARVYRYEQDSFTEEEITYLYELASKENWEAYRSTVSDFVKSGFREEVFSEDPAKFFEFWLKTGLEHPLTYVNSFLINTVDFWYPFSVVDGYQDVYGKSSYFDYKVSEPGTEVVLLPEVHEIYESISHDKEVQKIPGIFLVLSPGWYLMLFLVLFLYLWREKRYRVLIPLSGILFNFGTVLLGPIALVRYVLILFFAFPIYCVMLQENELADQ